MQSKLIKTASIALITILLATPAQSGWNKWWGQVTDNKCWQKIFKNDAYVQQNCKM